MGELSNKMVIEPKKNEDAHGMFMGFHGDIMEFNEIFTAIFMAFMVRPSGFARDN